ncbi:hypothetical protein B0T22DRAFT_35840 [Podospora appendiculata]|uniref:Dynamin family protein n=1 Tax=Podospora appendiculata TaxID=314037 RepID=A0AAE1CGA6_9PEZI|nr:hypothetical protein B0T22DRAFT_35840 [Podospora appendiculata]
MVPARDIKPRIKRELNGRGLLIRDIATPSETPQPPSPTSPTNPQSDHRDARSGAPSADPRQLPPASVLGSVREEGTARGEECVFMQVRPLGSPVPDDDSDVRTSFMGPDRALRDFGDRLKVYIDALGELQARGIQNEVKQTNLPELVLVGDQSSGKSSLMSAIAGLPLPRSSGTCTRCPVHIRISRAEEWSLRVSLQIDYDFRPSSSNRPITVEDVTDRDPFPPWVKCDRQVVEFKVIRDRFEEEIENVLRAAQIAILNPSSPLEMFIPKLAGEGVEEARQRYQTMLEEKAENPQAQFSPNIVGLEIKGPDMANLSFFDLPGVFVNAKRKEDRFLEKVVKNLTCQYISRNAAIILWAVPMNQDAENSYTFKLIEENNASNRCVGVMTKADLLPRDNKAADSWISMLDEKTHRTGLGYFITSRQGTNLDEQSKLEEIFFNRTAEPGTWPVVFDRYRGRCGIEKLVEFLSRKLAEEFSKSMPKVKAQVNSRLSKIVEDLSKYPDPPLNPELEIMRSLENFANSVKERVLHQEFESRWDRDTVEPFKASILKMKPVFNVAEPRNAIDLDNANGMSGSSRAGSVTPTPARKRPLVNDSRQPSTPKRVRTAASLRIDAVRGGESPSPVGQRQGTFAPSPLSSMASTNIGGRLLGPRSMSMLELRERIKQNAIPGQPGLVPATVYAPLYLNAAKRWKGPLDAFVKRTFDLLKDVIKAILDKSFGPLENRTVHKESTRHMNAFIDRCQKELQAEVDTIYNLETQRLFTKDEKTLKIHTDEERFALNRHRYYHRIAARQEELVVERIPIFDELTEERQSQEKLKIEKEMNRLGKDSFEQELEVAAYVRGYYVTAAGRFIDSVSIRIISGLLPKLADDVGSSVSKNLGMDALPRATALLNRLINEDPTTAVQREKLKNEKTRLDEAMAIIVQAEREAGHTPAQPLRQPEDEENATAAAAADLALRPPQVASRNATVRPFIKSEESAAEMSGALRSPGPSLSRLGGSADIAIPIIDTDDEEGEGEYADAEEDDLDDDRRGGRDSTLSDNASPSASASASRAA